MGSGETAEEGADEVPRKILAAEIRTLDLPVIEFLARAQPQGGPHASATASSSPVEDVSAMVVPAATAKEPAKCFALSGPHHESSACRKLAQPVFSSRSSAVHTSGR